MLNYRLHILTSKRFDEPLILECFQYAFSSFVLLILGIVIIFDAAFFPSFNPGL